MSIFTQVTTAPRDPILGLNEQFSSDDNPHKVNLGVGVYYDESGKIPLLQCVQAAEKWLLTNPEPKKYLPIDGIPAYDQSVQELVFGANEEPVLSARVVTVQTLGGTGALRVGADLLRKVNPQANVYISDPSWENHRAVFTAAGLLVHSYPYYEATQKGIDFAGMLAAIKQAPAGSIFVLHACCHNPTGYDLSPAQWTQVIAALNEREHTAFLDMAYQGFGYGLKEDSAVVQHFVKTGRPFLLANSFSKNFSLYGERVGALSVVCSHQEEATRVLSQLKTLVRANYSNPSTHGAKVVTLVLSTPDLRQQWEVELAAMRDRIKAMRSTFVAKLRATGLSADMGFITQQLGMFSYSGLSKLQMQRLRQEFGIYGTDSGRMCVAALNNSNIDYVVQGIAKVA